MSGEYEPHFAEAGEKTCAECGYVDLIMTEDPDAKGHIIITMYCRLRGFCAPKAGDMAACPDWTDEEQDEDQEDGE